MAIYLWEGKTRDGSMTTGSLQGDSEAAVIAQLKSQNVMVTKVKLKPKDLGEYLSFLQGGVKTRDLVILTRQLATGDSDLLVVPAVLALRSRPRNA